MFMHCEVCLTFEHQLRHYEVEIKTRIEVSPAASVVGIVLGESLGELKEELGKTQALYQRHCEKGHRAAQLFQNPVGAVE